MARSFTGGTSDRLSVSTSATLYNSAFSVIAWFQAPDVAQYRHIYAELGPNFYEQIWVRLSNTGLVQFYDRQSMSPDLVLASSGAYDDDTWRWIFAVRRAGNDHELYVDGTSVASNTSTTVGSSTNTPSNIYIGNQPDAPTEAWNGNLGPVWTFKAALGIDEARAVAYGRLTRQPTLFLPLGHGSPDPDWSGNGYNGTVTGTSISTTGPPARVISLAPRRAPYVVAAASTVFNPLSGRGGGAAHPLWT